MIRFKTIDPAKGEAPAPKAVEKPTLQLAGVETGAGAAGADAPAPKDTEKGKGPTRKAPLRAKKPAAARLFRD